MTNEVPYKIDAKTVAVILEMLADGKITEGLAANGLKIDYRQLFESCGLSRTIVQEESNLGTADVYHKGSGKFYRARLLKELTPEEYYFDPTDEPSPEASSMGRIASFLPTVANKIADLKAKMANDPPSFYTTGKAVEKLVEIVEQMEQERSLNLRPILLPPSPLGGPYVPPVPIVPAPYTPTYPSPNTTPVYPNYPVVTCQSGTNTLPDATGTSESDAQEGEFWRDRNGF